MISQTVQRLRRPFAATLVVAAVAMLAIGGTATAQEVRTSTDLFGYNIKSDASPLSVRFFEDFIPFPVAPGDAQFEMTMAYSRTNLTLGPQGVAVATNLWPGSPTGDGYGTVQCGMQQTFMLPGADECDDSTPYPYEARAKYPGTGEDDWRAQETSPPGAQGAPPNMFAEALGLDIRARAQGNPQTAGADELVSFGEVESAAESTMGQAAGTGTMDAKVSDVSVLQGIVSFESVQTVMRARSDGTGATTTGETAYSGLRVFGQPAELTENGIRFTDPPEPEPEPAGDDDGSQEPDEGQDCGPLTPLCDGADEAVGQVGDQIDPLNEVIAQITSGLNENNPQKSIGIGIEVSDHREKIDGAVGIREAGGVIVTIDIPVLQGYLAETGFYDYYREIVGGVPNEFGPLKGYLQELAGINPVIEFIFGRGRVQAGASEGFVFEPPTFDTPVLTPPASAVLPNTPISAPAPISGGSGSNTPSVAAPSQAILAGSYDAPMFGRVPLILAAFLLLVLAAPTWGLTTLRENAIGVNATIDDGAELPDLRALRGGPS